MGGHRRGENEARMDRRALLTDPRPPNRTCEVPAPQGPTALHPTYQLRDDDVELVIVAVVIRAVMPMER
jgi:hypothetical protein